MFWKTRLDSVVKIRKREEDEAKWKLSRARQAALQAQHALELARAKTMTDVRQNGSAAEWEIQEAARFRALKELAKAEQEVEELRRQEADARAQFETAHRKTEAVSRVAENKRQEMIKAAQNAERKQLDEIASVRHWRKE